MTDVSEIELQETKRKLIAMASRRLTQQVKGKISVSRDDLEKEAAGWERCAEDLSPFLTLYFNSDPDLDVSHLDDFKARAFPAMRPEGLTLERARALVARRMLDLLLNSTAAN